MSKRPLQKRATNPIVRRIDEQIAQVGGSRRSVSLSAKLDAGFLQKLEDRGPRAGTLTENLVKLAKASGVPAEDLLAVAPRVGSEVSLPPPDPSIMPKTADLPILGVAAGSIVGSLIISDNPLDYIERPPALVHIRDAYAVYIQNDSMDPLHSRGDLRFVHPHKPVRPGDSVVIQTLEPGGERQAWIKIFEKTQDDWLVCRQLNPKAEVKYKASQIERMHRVLTTAELFNR